MIDHECLEDKPDWKQELQSIYDKGTKCEMETLATKVCAIRASIT